MGLFEKLSDIPAMRPYLEQDEQAFVEDPGWRELLHKVRQLKDLETIARMVREACPADEKQRILRGYLCTMAAEQAEGAVELPCVDYAGCYLSRGELRLNRGSSESSASYVGMGMRAATPQCRILVHGDVDDFLAYRAAKASVEVRGSARDRVGMAVGEGFIRVEGDVAGGLGGNTHNTRLEVEGNVGRIQRDNSGCKILVGGDVNWNIGENQSDCFIKVCGNVAMRYKASGKLVEVAPGLSRNSVLMVGGDVWGHLGSRMEVARVLVWGKVHGEIHVADNQGGFIYLNKKSVPFYKRMVRSVGGDIGIKYVQLKESGYLFAEDPEDIKEIILG